MNGQAKVCTATNVTMYVDGVELPPVAIGSAPIGYAPLFTGVIDYAGYLPLVAPAFGRDDPLLPAVMRWVAARPFTGPGALMRRFGIGLHRARWLLIDMDDRGVVRGHWGRLVAAGRCDGAVVCAHRMYRVNHWAWQDLQGGAL